jgi:hypothetical protein
MGGSQSNLFLINHTTNEIRRVSLYFSKNLNRGLAEANRKFRWENAHIIELVDTRKRGVWDYLRDHIVFRCYDAEKEYFPTDWFAFEGVITKSGAN